MTIPHGSPRPRRLRRTETIRSMVRETALHPRQLVQPLFLIDGDSPSEAIESMPGQHRLNLADLLHETERLLSLGIHAVALFPALQPSLKSSEGDEALNPETLLLRAVRLLKKHFPEIQVWTDIALDPYTSHGHDGVLSLNGQEVDNDRTVDILTRMAVLHAEAGSDFVAPSDMMDGRVRAIRLHLDQAGFTQTGIVAYSAKFNSAFYGPFRDAVGSAQAAGTKSLSKATYQIDPANPREAARELLLDQNEGADILMVKPAGPYLDILHQAKSVTNLPLAAYQVSGEYAQIHAAARLGFLDLHQCRDESLLAIRRAGADIILSYFAADFAADYKH